VPVAARLVETLNDEQGAGRFEIGMVAPSGLLDETIEHGAAADLVQA
jgi:hypothetical protein